MDEFLEDHVKRERPSTYILENDTYGKHLESIVYVAVVNRRLYLGQIEESSLLFIPKRQSRNWKESFVDLAPSVVSFWFVGFSVLYTYPRSVKWFKKLFPNTKSFILTHIVRVM